MNFAYAYVMTPICVALLFAAFGYIRNKPRSGPGILGYPKKTAWLIFCGLPALIGFGAVMFFLSPRNSWGHPTADATFGSAVIAGYSLIYFHVRSFFVQLESSILTWGSVFSRKTLALSSIKRYAIIEGGRGGETLELRDARNRIAFRVADTVQDFGTLAADIRKQLPRDGVVFARRDRWGEWSEKAKNS
jgi:hypothetical protein